MIFPIRQFRSLLSAALALAALAVPIFAADAYQALAQKDYDSAIDFFRKALANEPGNANLHKDLAYTLLKAGENSEARDQFEAALHLNEHDETAALEYAFLAYETQKPIEARRMFERLRKKGTAATRTTAEQAFQNIDKPLGESIARWQQALTRSANPNDISTFSAHWELAQTAELRDDLTLAAEQYEICYKLKPRLSELLLVLARVWQQLNRVEEARAALLAASRESNSRTAELGLELWGARYPYPYEFVKALQIDPENIALRRELGFLYLAMQRVSDAIEQFQRVLAVDPNDHLSRDQLEALSAKKKASAELQKPAKTLAYARGSVGSGELRLSISGERELSQAGSVVAQPAPRAVVSTGAPSGAHSGMDAKKMGEKSLALGYARDAIRYLRRAHDDDPEDAEVMLKLGWAYNFAKDDQQAIQWFDRARHSDDSQIAAEAAKAFHNLNGDTPPQTSVWSLPMYSTRWHDVFSYGQIKRTVPLPWKDMNKWFSFYLSTRFIGDLKSSIPQNPIGPQYLSDSAFILGAGLSTKTWRRLTGWVEAGESIKYLPFRHDIGAAVPDYRGGLNFARGFGTLLGNNSSGFFFENSADAIYVSRYDRDWIFLTQNRAGRTFHPRSTASAQVLFNANYTHDLKNQYWAETIEMGPGFRLHMPWMRPGVYFSTDFLRGVYTNNAGNPRRPNYDDVRVGFWYAFAK